MYRDTATCQEMDLHFVPYGAIARVVVSSHEPHSRPLGFDVEHLPRLADAAEGDAGPRTARDPEAHGTEEHDV